jgi:hypothetical protein
MNRWEIRKQFGRRPSLEAVIIWSVQQVLKHRGIKHPDSKRQASRRQRDKDRRAEREFLVSKRRRLA